MFRKICHLRQYCRRILIKNVGEYPRVRGGLKWDGPGSMVAELERQIRINEDIIRYMTIRVDEHEEGPSAMMRKNERDSKKRRERSDRGDD